MNLILLDTHTLIWALDGNPKLSKTAEKIILNPSTVKLVPVIALTEIAIKAKLGKLTLPQASRFEDLETMVLSSGLTILNTTFEHVTTLFNLPDNKKHKDPFDRMIAAQAVAHQCNVLSCDTALDPYLAPYPHSTRIW